MKNLSAFDWLILIFINIFILTFTQFWFGRADDLPESQELLTIVIIRFSTFSILPILTSLFYRFVNRKKAYAKSLALKILIICLLSDFIGCFIFYFKIAQ